jgi:hypothetical protein
LSSFELLAEGQPSHSVRDVPISVEARHVVAVIANRLVAVNK